MSLNMDRLRDKLEQLKNPGKRTNRPTWKPNKEGDECMVRLVPYPYGDDPDDPFLSLWFHYGIGTGMNSSFLCPQKNHSKSCPVCDFASSLYNNAGENEQDRKQAKDMFAKQRFHTIVVDRADDTPTPKLWGFGKIVYQSLLDDLVNGDLGNYFDFENGLDLKVQYEKGQGQSYPTTKLRFARKETPLAASDAQLQEIRNAIPKHSDLFEPLTKSQIQEKLNDWMDFGGDDDPVKAEAVSVEVTRGGNDKPASTVEETTSSNNVADIDAAFADALA